MLNKKTFGASLAVLLSLAAIPAIAYGNAGDEQYCDPFTGCQIQKTDKPKDKKSDNNTGRRTSDSSNNKQSTEAASSVAPAPVINEQIQQVIQKQKILQQKRSAKAERLEDLHRVLTAAGLDAFYPMIMLHLEQT